MRKFATPTGTEDILPEDWPYFDFVIDHAVETAQTFGYRRIETPNFAETSLFARSSGQGTDIVDKEMYTFLDRDGDEFSLRPEGTAPVMRAYLQHGWDRRPQPVKLFYIERMYRYDRPQRGRLREHRQFGCEAIGVEDAYLDVELISLLDHFYRQIGLDDLSLHINSIGDSACRPDYLRELVAYLTARREELAPLDRQRLERNPLRVLDSKEAASQPVIAGAPAMTAFLCADCRAHWDKLRRGLELVGLKAVVDPRLVRGLDYYTRTVFEFLPPREGAQSVVGAGGRYDALAEALGARHIPGIGFGAGLERIVLNVRDRGIEVPPAHHPRVYIAHAGEGTEDAALKLATRLRREGIATDMAYGDRSLRSQMKHADASGASVAAIVGEEELQNQTVMLRSLRAGEQQSVPLEALPVALEEGLGSEAG